ncbi:hypothetical protein Scep_013376 [Stephania cephalantha]|uniref:Uncharacterized protein n=1 Tax=Stephania cephalantha TaxID=152367 RepID=A0AAP0JIQ6_9MAGN
MPQDLPGFYYDSEKNRYFPIKGPIPGSASWRSRKPKHEQEQRDDARSRRKRIKTCELIGARELCGRVVNSSKWRCGFQGEYQRIQASQPVIWEYQGLKRVADSGLEQFHIDVQTQEGQHKSSVLLMGCIRDPISLCEIGGVGHGFYGGSKFYPECVWPVAAESRADGRKAPNSVWNPRASLLMPSNISCIKKTMKHSPDVVDASSAVQHALISTLGSEGSGGSVYIIKFDEPLDLSFLSRRRICKVASLNCTIWTADCSPIGFQAAVGKVVLSSTNAGVTSINLETGVPSQLCLSKSDVFALQFDHSIPCIVLIWIRNGAIVTIDVRQRQRHLARLAKHKIYPVTYAKTSSSNALNSVEQCFEIKGNIVPSCTACMPSSVSSLVSLQMYDQHFLASSMDGLIKLYDHRMMQKGSVQSYEGHVNSHTRIQLGVDQAERLIISGGEDGKVRVWSIKTGELLFAEKISKSVPATVCWSGIGERNRQSQENQIYEECLYGNNSGAWLGSREELFYMQF